MVLALGMACRLTDTGMDMAVIHFTMGICIIIRWVVRVLDMVGSILTRPWVWRSSLTSFRSSVFLLATSGAMEESLGRKEKRKKDPLKHKEVGDRRDE